MYGSSHTRLHARVSGRGGKGGTGPRALAGGGRRTLIRAEGDTGELGGPYQDSQGSGGARSAHGSRTGSGAEALAQGTGRGAPGARYLKKSDGVLREGVAARYAFMKQWRLEYPVEIMARVLEVSRSGFYAWLERPPSVHALEDERLKVAITAAHVKTRETYGAKRLQAELQAEGFAVGRDRIARLRRELGICCQQKRPFRATTSSHHDRPVAENLVGQCFDATAPNEVWHTDITSIPTGEGWL